MQAPTRDPAAEGVPPPALELRNVAHAYRGRRVVDGVDLAIAVGETVCLVGPSGCGKSTLLRIAAGLERLQDGEVRINGVLVAGDGLDTPPERRGIGLVFQDFALFPHLSVLDNVRFGLSRQDGARDPEWARTLIGQLGLAAFAEAYPHMLSGGQQQRVALARALAPRPSILLLDEPFSSLDYLLRDQVRDDTLEVLRASHVATLIVTHDPEEALYLADRIALMNEGRIVQRGTPSDLYFRPASAFAARFFGDVNRLGGRVEGGRVETVFGPLPASGLPETAEVEVLIRPEALRILPPGAGIGPAPLAEVEATRMLGHSALVRLGIADGRGERRALRARVPAREQPAEHSTVAVALDPAGAFVFRAGA
jgi:iron(III) transport system ATP-binding protein